MTARPMTEECADELLDDFEQAVSDRAEDGMSYRPRVDGPRDEAREALRAALLSSLSAERGMREALEGFVAKIDPAILVERDLPMSPLADELRAALAALSARAGEDEQATRADDGPTAPTDL